VLSTGIYFDPFDEAVLHDPYPAYRSLRDKAPLYRNDRLDFWAVSQFDDVQAVLRDHRTFSSAEGVDLDRTSAELLGPGNFNSMDPPLHDVLRNIVRSRFTPKAISALEPAVRTTIADLIDRFAERGSADLVSELASPLPLDMVSEILGVPQADRPRLAELFEAAFERHAGEAELPKTAHAPARALNDYFLDEAARRRRNPQPDLLTQVATATIDGKRVEEEVSGICFLLFAAGSATARNLISSALLLLAEHPDVRSLLAAQLDLLPRAIEEFLRLESPIQNEARTVTCDVTIRGETVRSGARIVALIGSANRDDRRFEDPDKLDVRRVIRRHLAFGEGIHFCLGAPLARLEARVALELVLTRITNYEVSGPIVRTTRVNERGLTSLPVKF
jgi:cytochrome P450